MRVVVDRAGMPGPADEVAAPTGAAERERHLARWATLVAMCAIYLAHLAGSGEVNVLRGADQAASGGGGDHDAFRGNASMGAQHLRGPQILSAVVREHLVS